jgi:hypothetical protein
MTQCRPLVDILTEIPDFRKEKGKRHPLPALRGRRPRDPTSFGLCCHDVWC